MEKPIPELTAISENLNSLLKNAGFKVTINSVSGNLPKTFLLLPDSGTRLELEWQPLINDTVLLSAGIRARSSPEYNTVLATRSLSKNTFARCVESGQSVLDSAGNGFISIPGFRFERLVASGLPRRLPVSGTPFSARASRLVRVLLCDPRREWSQSELVEATGVTQGFVSKCLKMLIHQSYVVSSGSKWRLIAPDVLLDDWAAHYRFDRHSLFRFAFSFPTYDDGLKLLGDKLSKAGIRYAFTGWSGAHLRMPYAIPPKIVIFAQSLPEDPANLGLYSVESKENVLLILPRDDGVFQFCQGIEGLNVVSDPQIYVDLYRQPGRAQEQAQVLRTRLMNWKDADRD